MLFVNLSYASLLGKTNVRQDKQHEMMTYLRINVEAVFADLCDQGGMVAYACRLVAYARSPVRMQMNV